MLLCYFQGHSSEKYILNLNFLILNLFGEGPGWASSTVNINSGHPLRLCTKLR